MPPPRSHQFIAGSISLCFVDTLGRRSRIERLSAPQDLAAWMEAAGLPTEGVRIDEKHVVQARSLREAIFRCASSIESGSAVPLADVEMLNRFAQPAPPRPRLQDGKVVLTTEEPVSAAFSLVAADAIELIGGPRRHKIRTCPECRMVFVDTSRPGRRRWCSSASACGNRAKVREHRERRSRTQ
jgi:predicted RNA-binding Zn ribbon-like protein